MTPMRLATIRVLRDRDLGLRTLPQWYDIIGELADAYDVLLGHYRQQRDELTQYRNRRYAEMEADLILQDRGEKDGTGPEARV